MMGHFPTREPAGTRFLSGLRNVIAAAVFLIVLTLLLHHGASAQTGSATPTSEAVATPETTPAATEQSGPDIPLVHTVQAGETLLGIAEQYGTTVEALQALNNLGDTELIYAGQPLLIPGGGGDVVAAVHTIQVGDTLRGLAAGYNTTIEALASSGRLINPYYLPAGSDLTVLSRNGTGDFQPVEGEPYVVGAGDTVLTVAAQFGLSPSALLYTNDLPHWSRLLPGERLVLPADRPYQDLPGSWQQITVYPVPAVQGGTVVIYVENRRDGLPSGQFAGQPLQFAAHGSGFVALAGIDAFTEPGRYPLQLEGSGDRPWQPFSQEFTINSAGFGTQYITIPVELSALLDPALRAEEDAFLATIYTQFSQPALWDGIFSVPVTNTVVTAPYGDGRSYNEGPVEIYHSGTDFAGVVGTPIYAPAAGTVVFSDTLELRGNTLIIDHGLGVMTGYYHLSDTHVAPGVFVSQGQLIAEGGSTGLSSGPHLHWEVRVNGVSVNGQPWLDGLALPPVPLIDEQSPDVEFQQ